MIVPVTVVLVNYNVSDHLSACLSALQQQSLDHTVVVVDNNSTDGALAAIHDAFPTARMLPLRRNVGFARAVNIAASRFGDPDGVVVTLNPDTIPGEGFLENLVSPFSGRPHVGAVAGTLVFASDPTVIASAGIDMHRNGVALDVRLGEQWSAGTTTPVFGASAGAAAYRHAALSDAGWFPDHFFLYLEDVDLAWRLQLRGWETLSSPNAVASHVYSASAIEGSSFKRRLLARNRVWALARCLPADIWKRDRMSIAGFDTVAVGYAIARGDLASLRGRMEGVAGLPLRIQERRMIQSRSRVNAEQVDHLLKPAVSAAKLLRLRTLTRRLSGTTGS